MPHVNSKHTYQEIRIATWNVRSLTNRKPNQLAALAGACGYDIVIIQETRRDETHGERISGSYCLWCSGHNGTHNHGVGFLVHDRIKILEFTIHKVANSSARAAQIIVSTKTGRRSIYALYAPHTGYGEDTVRHFWEDAADLPDIAKSIIGVDANAHVHPSDWNYPPHQPNQKLEIPGTTMCGLHLLAFTNTLDLRPANMMQAGDWSTRTTFTGNLKAPRDAVIDFLLVPAKKSNEFKTGASVQSNHSALTSDHLLLAATWRVTLNHSTKAPNTRPTMGPTHTNEDQDLNPSDDIYRELFCSVRTLHPDTLNEHDNARQQHTPAHTNYRIWRPSMSHIEKLENLVASLRRSSKTQSVTLENDSATRNSNATPKPEKRTGEPSPTPSNGTTSRTPSGLFSKTDRAPHENASLTMTTPKNAND